MTDNWTDILLIQPEQYQRVLVKLLGGSVRITTYDKFDYGQWAIAFWKAMPMQAVK